jgi:hypothetical protein
LSTPSTRHDRRGTRWPSGRHHSDLDIERELVDAYLESAIVRAGSPVNASVRAGSPVNASVRAGSPVAFDSPNKRQTNPDPNPDPNRGSSPVSKDGASSSTNSTSSAAGSLPRVATRKPTATASERYLFPPAHGSHHHASWRHV